MPERKCSFLSVKYEAIKNCNVELKLKWMDYYVCRMNCNKRISHRSHLSYIYDIKLACFQLFFIILHITVALKLCLMNFANPLYQSMSCLTCLQNDEMKTWRVLELREASARWLQLLPNSHPVLLSETVTPRIQDFRNCPKTWNVSLQSPSSSSTCSCPPAEVSIPRFS